MGLCGMISTDLAIVPKWYHFVFERMKFKLLGIKSSSGYSSCPNCLECRDYLYKVKAGSLCFQPRVDMESRLASPVLATLNGIGAKLFECTAIDQLYSIFEGNLKSLTKMIFFFEGCACSDPTAKT